jgi:uncharacterized cupin superfamily protein
VLDGEFEFEVGSETFRGRSGAYVFIPAGVPHAVSNGGDVDARCLLIMSPPTHDRYFQELVELLAKPGPPDPDAIAALRERYDTEQISTLTA